MKKFTKSKVWDYVFLHLIIFQMSIGGIFSKTAASKEFLSFEFFLFYGLMILNLGVYAILWQQVLKRIPLTTAFCNKRLSIWNMYYEQFSELQQEGIIGLPVVPEGSVILCPIILDRFQDRGILLRDFR